MNYKTAFAILIPITVLISAFALADESSQLKPLPRFLRSPKLADRYLSTRDIEDVMKFERKEPVCRQLLKRADVPDDARLEALLKLAEILEQDATLVLLEQITTLSSNSDDKTVSVLNDLSKLVTQLPKSQLAKHRSAMIELSEQSDIASLRQASLIAVLVADGSMDKIWAAAESNETKMVDLLLGARSLQNSNLQQQMFQRMLPLIESSDPKSKPPRSSQFLIKKVTRRRYS